MSLLCVDGHWAHVPCAGPAGCVAASGKITCDTSYAIEGAACPPGTTSQACQSVPAALLGCVGGTWQSVASCDTCKAETGTADCTQTPDAGTPPDGGMAVFDPADVPQIVPLGGSVIASPKVQIIDYASDPTSAHVDAFLQELLSTQVWSMQTAEYGVGTFTALPTIHLTGSPPASWDDNNEPSQLTQFLGSQISGPADPSTLYMFIVPPGSNVSSGGNCCSDFLGYHWDMLVGSTRVPYGIVCNCPPSPGDPLTTLQYSTTTLVHELVEVATDPFTTDWAWGQPDDDHIIWSGFTGGEVSDMCQFSADANVIPDGGTYMVQRSWSNAAALAGHQPCLPASSPDPYFNSYPVLPDTARLSNYGYPTQTKVVKIPVGSSATIDVKLVSDGPVTGPWTVTAWDMNSYLGYGGRRLTFSWDRNTGNNGDILHLTINVLSKDSQLGGEGFVLQSDLGGQQNLTAGVVVN